VALRDWGAGENLARTVESEQVATFMDRSARTINEETDILSLAQIFLQTPYRRLPVLRDGKLVGQVSRRDLLQAVNDLIAVSPHRKSTLLYLSALVDRQDAPIQ
jgi:CBS-domain-containing membrane protein